VFPDIANWVTEAFVSRFELLLLFDVCVGQLGLTLYEVIGTISIRTLILRELNPGNCLALQGGGRRWRSSDEGTAGKSQVDKESSHTFSSTFSLVFKCSPSMILNALCHPVTASSRVTICHFPSKNSVEIWHLIQEEALCARRPRNVQILLYSST
jgi:hypothetical protein